MPKRARSYHDWLIKRLTDPREAARYLKTAKEDSLPMFLKALRNVAEAKKMAVVAEEVGVNRESLYKSLSEDGNPALLTIDAVLNTVGMTLMPCLKDSTPEQTMPPQSIASAKETEENIATGERLGDTEAGTATFLFNIVRSAPAITSTAKFLNRKKLPSLGQYQAMQFVGATNVR